MISIKKGIELPITGHVHDHIITPSKIDGSIGIIGSDYLGLKPTMIVQEGDLVKKGQALFEDKNNPGVQICSPISGKVENINRGERRKLLSVVISPLGDDAISFSPLSILEIDSLTGADISDRLQKIGFWAFFRKRPFNKIPAITEKPHSIFVNMMDSNPLAINPFLALAGREEDYHAGLNVISKLTDGDIHVCYEYGEKLPLSENTKIKPHDFSGIHPKGLVGTHIHFIDSVGPEKTVWHLDLQDLLAIGHLFLKGEIDNHRAISVAGPSVINPFFAQVIQGANLSKLLESNTTKEENRIISGSVFSGRKVEAPCEFLGAYDRQIIVLPEGRNATFLEFVRPGANSYSKSRTYLGRFIHKVLPFNTSVQGSPRSLLPFELFEKVTPLDILPALLIKALIIKDTDTAIQLGALELDEEDIALLTYVDPGKHDLGAILRENLEEIEKEG